MKDGEKNFSGMMYLLVGCLFLLVAQVSFARNIPESSGDGASSVLCEVQVCNKLSRFSLNPWSHLKDKIGETCFPVTLRKKDAVVGAVLDSETRFYQGSFNPTKKSVTRVKKVISCQDFRNGEK